MNLNLFRFYLFLCISFVPISFSYEVNPVFELLLKKKEDSIKCIIRSSQFQADSFKNTSLDESKNELSFKNAYYFSIMSGIAYLEEDKAIPLYQVLGFKNIKFFENVRNGADSDDWIVTDTQAYWVEDNQNVYLIFRGTDSENNNNDTFTNLAFALQDFGTMGRVHSGFYGALTYFWKQLATQFDSLRQVKNLHVIGHSMGGALATLTAAKLLQRQANNDSIYSINLEEDPLLKTKEYSAKVIVKGLTTFGSPKTGDDQFATTFDYLVYKAQNDPLLSSLEARGFYSSRFVNKNDLVATVPNAFMGYEHVSTLNYMTPQGTILKGNDALAVAPTFWTSDIFRWLKDHHMIRYAVELGVYLKQPVEQCWD